MAELTDEKLFQTDRVRASVLIPVKNGGALLGEVLDAVLAQRTPWPFEVLVIDSGSTDGSVDLARARGVDVTTIPPQEFRHGHTRNALASRSRGEFLIFLTQDAKPASDQWLVRLVEGCDSDDSVAGAFGPHRAHPGARHVTHRELDEHFAGFGKTLTLTRLDDKARFESDPGYRQFLHFFSSNNSCIRRSVWEKLPLPDVAFAEDQTWALSAIKAGYSKAFVPEAVVFHSHDFGVWETFQRNFDESRSFERYFGYRMQRNLRSALRSSAVLCRRDFRWLRDAGVQGWALFKNSIYMCGIEAARTLGQLLGARHHSVPSWLQRLVSRDQQMQNKGAA